jgi:hypothetical protein
MKNAGSGASNCYRRTNAGKNVRSEARPCFSYSMLTSIVAVAFMEPLVPVTVTVYSPAVVPPCVCWDTLPLVLEHPLAPRRNAPSRRTPIRDRLERRRGTMRNTNAASMLPPPTENRECRSAAAGAGDVDKVSVAVTAFVPLMEGGWLTEQAGGSTALNGVVAMAQDKATAPVKPPLGVMVMVEVPLDPLDLMVTAVPVKANWPLPPPPPGERITMSMVVEAVTVPAVPLTVMV